MRARTQLRVASISKPLTAIAVLRLCQEGRLSLDAPVFGTKGLLKQLKIRGDKRLRKVTVRHLLQHSAGWDRDLAGDAVFWKVPPPSDISVTSPEYNRHLLQYVLNRKLQFSPGTRHAYSNLGYLALGEVIEEVTGSSYEQYIKSLLAEISVKDMFVGSEDRACWQSDEAEYFNIRDPPTAHSIMPGQEGSSVLPQYGSFLMSNTGAYGGWVGTAHDVLKIFLSLDLDDGHSGEKEVQAKSLYTNPTAEQSSSTKSRLLNDDSVKQILKCPPYEHGRDWYGLGFDAQDWGKTWGHTGAMEGTCGTVQCHHSGLAWAFLLNAWATDSDLDGVVKLALTSVPDLTPFPANLRPITHCPWTVNNNVQVSRETSECNEGTQVTRKRYGIQVQTHDSPCVKNDEMQLCGTEVQTQDRAQKIVMWVPFESVLQSVTIQHMLEYHLTWIGVNDTEVLLKPLTFNLIFSKTSEDRTNEQDKKLLFGIDVADLKESLSVHAKDGLQPEFLTTFVSEGKLLALALLVHTDICLEQEIHITVCATEYVRLFAKQQKRGYLVVSQCVTQWQGELLVTAVIVKPLNRHNPLVHAATRTVNSTDCTYEEVQLYEKLSMVTQTEELTVSNKSLHKSTSSEATPPEEGYLDRMQSVAQSPPLLINCQYANCQETEESHSEQSSETCCPAVSSQSQTCTRNLGKSSHSSRRTASSLAKCNPLVHAAIGTVNITGGCIYNRVKKRPAPLKTLSWVQMTLDSLVTELGRQAKHHCGLRYVQHYMVDGEPFVSGVWLPSSEYNCYHRVGVSRYGLLPALAEAATLNVRLRFIGQYVEEGAVYHAIFWNAPSDA